MSLTAGAYLMHFGRKGQKWGDRNGPPYPLDFDKLSPEERAQAKQESIDKGDTVTAQANVKYYTTKEIDDLIIKNNKNKQLSEVNGTSISKGEKFAEKFIKGGNMYVDVVGTGSKVYNITAKVVNAFAGTELPIIGEKGESKEQKHLNELKYKKELLETKNAIKRAEKEKEKLSGKAKEDAEEKLKKLKKETELLELKAKQAEAEKKIREAQPKNNKEDPYAEYKEETNRINRENARIQAEANLLKAQNELAEQEARRRQRLNGNTP